MRRPLNGWMIRIDDIDPVAVRQFSKKPFLEVKTDFPGMETFEMPVSPTLRTSRQDEGGGTRDSVK